MEWVSAARTDQGRIRAHNEDNYLLRPDIGLFAVADGMGGHAAGEVASALAVQQLELAFANVPAGAESTAIADGLEGAVASAGHAIVRAGADDARQRGMGTTLTAMAMSREEESYRIAHVGDSRAYLLRNGVLTQISVDHTWVQQQVDRGLLTPDNAWRHPLSSILTRALGTEQELEIDSFSGTTRDGDIFMLCSDGLTQVLRDPDIHAVLISERSIEEMVDRLIAEANERGGPDNVTVVAIRVEG